MLKSTTVRKLVDDKFQKDAVAAGNASNTDDVYIYKLISEKRDAVELVNGDFVVLSKRIKHIDVDTRGYSKKPEITLEEMVSTSFPSKLEAAKFMGIVDKQLYNALRAKRHVFMLEQGGFLLAPKNSIIFNLSGMKYNSQLDTKARKPYSVKTVETRHEGFDTTHKPLLVSDFINNYFQDKTDFAQKAGKPIHTINLMERQERKVVKAYEDGVWCLLSKITIFIDVDVKNLPDTTTRVSYQQLIDLLYGDTKPTIKEIAKRLGVGGTSVVNWSTSNMHFIRLKAGGWLTAPDKLVQFTTP